MTPKDAPVAARARGRALLLGFLILVAGWAAAGVRVLDPAAEFGVVVSAVPGLSRSVTARRLVWVPPGLAGEPGEPREPVDLELPDAEHARLPSEDGSPYGLKGTIRLRALPEQGLAVARASGGRGLKGVLLGAVRAACAELRGMRPAERAVPTGLEALEARLHAELAARGSMVVSVRIDGFDTLMSATPTAPVPPDRRVLIVGLDGADWEIIDPLIAAGRMPHLARLIATGARAKLLTITPTLSPVVWTSIATGVEPARHGIFDFLTGADTGPREPVSSRSRKVPALWDLLSTAGVPVAVTGWWATWPAERVAGTMVTDRVAYQLFGYASDERSSEGKTWPPELYETIRPLIVPPDQVPWSEVAAFLDGSRKDPKAFDADEREILEEFRTLLASSHTYLGAALAQRRSLRTRFEAVYFEGTDTVGHLFMPYRPPVRPGVDPRRFESFHDIVDRYYEAADGMLAKLLDGRSDWTVIVLSDHGFASDATRPRTTDSRIGHGAAADWHRRFGILVMSGPGVRPGVKIDEASVYDIAPTVLALFGQPIPTSWPGAVLGSALEPALFARYPVRYRADDPQRASSHEAPAGEAADAEAAELREKLQSLGYVGAQPETPMTTKNNRGVALLAEGKYPEAAAEFRRAITEAPDQAALWVNLGIALRFEGKVEEARALFVKAMARPATLRAASLQLSQLDADAGDFARAAQVLEKVLEREPDAADVRNALGLIEEKAGHRERARREYETAARLDPNAAEPRSNLGNLDKAAGRGDSAERWYREAIAADPFFMGAYNNLALLLQERGEDGAAIELYGRALAKAPKNAVVLNNLASLYFATGDHGRAKEYWTRATSADPDYPSPWNNLAGLALSEGRLEDAESGLRRALALDPHYGDAHINRSLLLRRRGDMNGARAELIEAASDERSAIAARIELGVFELSQGRPRYALESLEEARRKGGARTDILNPLGEAYARLGDTPRAAEAWRESLRIDPKQDKLAAAISRLTADNK